MACKCFDYSVGQYGSATPQTSANKGVGGSKVNSRRLTRARARLFVCAPSPRSKMFAFLIAALRPNFRFIYLRGEIV